MVDIQCYFDVMVIEGLSCPTLAILKLLQVQRAIDDFDMALLTIPDTSSAEAKVLLLSRYVDGKMDLRPHMHKSEICR